MEVKKRIVLMWVLAAVMSIGISVDENVELPIAECGSVVPCRNDEYCQDNCHYASHCVPLSIFNTVQHGYFALYDQLEGPRYCD